MIRLFTSSYAEPGPERRHEYAEALLRNLGCKSITEVCVVVEGAAHPLATSAKLRTRSVERRPLYEDFFRWINDLAAKDDVSIVANSDISFEDSIAIAGKTLGPKMCYAMARWDGNEVFDRNDSQDCWVFRGPVTAVDGHFPLGVPRCDNRLLHELQRAGYVVRNPAFSIRTLHHHANRSTEYPDANLRGFVAPPYRYLWPHNLWSLPKTRWHNCRHPETALGWRFDRRRMSATLAVRALRKAGRGIRSLSARAGNQGRTA